MWACLAPWTAVCRVGSWLSSVPGSLALICLTLVLPFCPCFSIFAHKFCQICRTLLYLFSTQRFCLLLGIPHMEFRIILEHKGTESITYR